MTSSTILGMFRLSPFESLLKPSVCYYKCKRSGWELGGHSDSMVCLREACPRVTTLAPRTLTSPSLCLAGFGADGVPLNRIWAFMTAHVRPAR